MNFISHDINIRYTNAVSQTDENCHIRLPGLSHFGTPISDVRRQILEDVQALQTANPELSEADAKTEAYMNYANNHIEDSYQQDIFKFYGLLAAVTSGNLSAMKRYLDDGVSPNGPQGRPCVAPLYMAMPVGVTPTKLLLEYGALRDPDPMSPRPISLIQLGLQIPVSLEVIEILVDAGCFNEHDFECVTAILNVLRLNNATSHKSAIERFSHAESLLTTPRTLACLTRRAVAKSLGAMPARRDKVAETKLPQVFQRDLLCADLMELI